MRGLARSGSSRCRRRIGWRKPRACVGRYAPAASWCMGATTAARCPPGDSPSRSTRVLAFGTAHHATTRGCLIALDRLAKREHPRSVLDIGTGTGILAIAAARALNANVVASDMDPIAVAVAAENARTNGVQSRVIVVEADGSCASGVAACEGRSAVRQHPAPPPARPRSGLLPRAQSRRDLRALRPSRAPSAAGGGAFP